MCLTWSFVFENRYSFQLLYQFPMRMLAEWSFPDFLLL